MTLKKYSGSKSTKSPKHASCKEKTTEFIRKAMAKHGNKYNYSKTKYINSKEKLIIICKIHGEFKQSASHHLWGGLCSKCNYLNNNKYTIKDFITKANQTHGTKYDYSEAKYKNSITPIKIICPIHKAFWQTPNNHINAKSGCKKCGILSAVAKQKKNIKSTYSQNITTKDFISHSKDIHGNKYDYSLTIYTNCKNKVTIICPKHGSFEQTPSSHKVGAGCKPCSIELSSKKRSSNTKKFVKKSVKIHGYHYDYSQTEYVNSTQKVKIICPNHGIFFQMPYTHLKHGCVKCGYEMKGYDKTLSLEEFIQRAKKIHNNKYSYDKAIYKKMNSKITITCPLHGDFSQSAANHLYQKNECPRCKKSSYSKIAIEWLDHVAKKENISIQHAVNGSEHKILDSKYKADGYCAETNTIYEFLGCFYHGCPICHNKKDINKINNITYGNLYKKTMERNDYIISKGYNLVIIWEHEYHSLKKRLSSDTIELVYNIANTCCNHKTLRKYLTKYEINVSGITKDNFDKYKKQLLKIFTILQDKRIKKKLIKIIDVYK